MKNKNNRNRVLNEFAQVVHKANEKWWHNMDTGERLARNPLELLALVNTEFAEALEGERKSLMDDKLKHRRMPEVEMADAVIRLCDFAAGFGFTIKSGAAHEWQEWMVPDNKGEAIHALMSEVCIRPLFVGTIIEMIECYCDKHGYDLWGAVDEKMAYNATREDHTHEARKAANGKKF